MSMETQGIKKAEEWLDYIRTNQSVVELVYFDNTPLYAFSDGEADYVTQAQMSGTKTAEAVFDTESAFLDYIRGSDVTGYPLEDAPIQVS